MRIFERERKVAEEQVFTQKFVGKEKSETFRQRKRIFSSAGLQKMRFEARASPKGLKQKFPKQKQETDNFLLGSRSENSFFYSARMSFKLPIKQFHLKK